MENRNPEINYQARKAEFESLAASARVRSVSIAWARAAVFVGTAVGIWLTYNLTAWVPVGIGVAGFAAFLGLVRFHIRLNQRYRFLKALTVINQEEAGVLNGEFSQFSEGTEFREPDHAYEYDLDVFGAGSVFQYLERSASLIGRTTLAKWLKEPLLSGEAITKRQEAVEELANQLDLRQRFLANGRLSEEKEGDHQRLLDWCENPSKIAEGAFYRIALWVVPVLSVAALVFLIQGWMSFGQFMMYLIVPFGLVVRHLKDVNRQMDRGGKMLDLLRMYDGLLERIEGADFQTERLRQLQSQLATNGSDASGAIRKFGSLLTDLESRNNAIGGLILNYFVVWDLVYIRRIQAWQRAHREHLHQWFAVIEEFDALCCLANYRYNRADTIFPSPDEHQRIEATGLGHPLLITGQRVDNDFELKYNGHFVILTGANMAGKSTFLRTVGVNLVLALAGAPVVASQFQFSPVQLFSSMRTTDSLQKHESYFFTELKRLKQLVDRLAKGEKLFIILDEILKGTNSRDKEMGSKAFVRRLTQLGAGGIVATHDLSLCTLDQELGDRISNRCFEVDITPDGLVFDYQIRSGVCRNMNASYLMKDMGITE